MTLINDVGLLCMAIDGSKDRQIVGRTKLQKMIYFCQYLDWDIRDYRLHYYGPFSFTFANTVKTAGRLQNGLNKAEPVHTPLISPRTERHWSKNLKKPSVIPKKRQKRASL